MSLNPLPAERDLQRRLAHFVKEDQVLRVGFGRAARDRLPDSVSRNVLGSDIFVATAVHRLVTLRWQSGAMRKGSQPGRLQPPGACRDVQLVRNIRVVR